MRLRGIWNLINRPVGVNVVIPVISCGLTLVLFLAAIFEPPTRQRARSQYQPHDTPAPIVIHWNSKPASNRTVTQALCDLLAIHNRGFWLPVEKLSGPEYRDALAIARDGLATMTASEAAGRLDWTRFTLNSQGTLFDAVRIKTTAPFNSKL